MSNAFGMTGSLDSYLAPIFPAGEFRFTITKCEVQDTRSGNGKQAVFSVKVLDGPQQNRTRTFYCDATTEIGRKDIAQITGAVGFAHVMDPPDYVGKNFIGEIVHKVNKKDGKTYPNLGECKRDTGPAKTVKESLTVDNGGELRSPF